MPKRYWLIKQEPESYSWATFVKDGHTTWAGVRNFQARNNLRAMERGDLVLYYHSVSEKQIVGIAEVAKTAYPDPTATEGDWSCVDLTPLKPLSQPVSLELIKGEDLLKNMALVKNSRLSVTPVTVGEFARILKLAKTKL
jgi:predicted RNA-binding protein with PUA-like domain